MRALPDVDAADELRPAAPAADAAVVSLHRLLGLATLTPPQAVHVALEVLTALEHEPVGRFDSSDVLIDAQGAVRLAERDGDGAAPAAAAALLSELAHNADRPAAHRRPANAALLAALEQGAQPLAAGNPDPAVAGLRRTLDATGLGSEKLAAELAALVSVPLVRVGAHPAPVTDPAVAGIVEPLAPAEPGLLPDESAPPVAPVANRLASPQQRRRLLISAAAAVLVLAAVMIAIALSRPSGKPAEASTGTPPAGPTAAATTPARAATHAGPRAVPALAPAAAGPVSRVRLHPLHACSAGTTCRVNVRIYLRPPGLTNLTWHATLVDRCTGTKRTIDHGSMIAAPGWRSAYATVSLPLPRARSIAVVAVVDTPVSAASKPMLVPATGGSCSRQ